MSTLVISNAYVATVAPDGAEYASGHLVAVDGRITAVGPGPAPLLEGASIVDGSGCLLTPGLINTHHHLYQWATRGYALDSTLFEWLTSLYPVWARINADVVGAAATAGLAWLARSGCTTSTDHHYVFPRGGGDVLGATVSAARQIGLRFHPTRGSMDLGQSHGGLPPDSVVESLDTILAASQEAGYRHLAGVAERCLGESLMADDRIAAAGHLEAAVHILEEVGARNEVAKALVAQAKLHRTAGDVSGARCLLERALTLFETLGTLDEPHRVQALLATLQDHR